MSLTDKQIHDLNNMNVSAQKARLGNILSTEGQADWNQNDETAPDYIKNRPFYDVSTVTTIIPEETVTFSNMDGLMTASWPSTFNPVYGSIYTVKIDGNAYNCACIRVRDGVPALGNLSLIGIGEDTGEPFIMLYQGSWLFASTDSASEHTVSISGTLVRILKIDEKYLPEATNVTSGITKIQVRNLDTTKSYSTEEIEEIYQSVRAGAAIYLTYGDVITSVEYSPNNHFTFELSNGQKQIIHPVDGVWDFTNGETRYPNSIDFGAYYTNYANISCKASSGIGGIQAPGYELVDTNMAGFRGNYIQAEHAIVLKLQNAAKYLYIEANADGEINVIKRLRDQASGGDITTLFKNGDDSMILKSSTEGSTKKFKITVDDNGTLSTSEVTE